MIATALTLPSDQRAGVAARWRQLVDIVVQARGTLSAQSRADAIEAIAAMRTEVPVDERRRAARQIGGRAADVDTVVIFGNDEPGVAAAVLMAARLSDAEWRGAIPRILPSSRALLRNRRDLPPAAVAALSTYGASDFALPPGEGVNLPDAGTQIRELVARIEAFRQGTPRPAQQPDVAAAPAGFAFETGADGTIDWVGTGPREALIGVVISDNGAAGSSGVDGQAVGAFRRRAPFRDARLSIAGSGPTGGLWLISASPIFNPLDGRFAGYRGTARRPRADEVAGPVPGFAGTTLPVDSLRQLIHELRTPLNAILGFAEMIEQQLLGPAALPYRARAREILTDGRQLLDTVDDLDQAARTKREGPSSETLDPRPVLDRALETLRPMMQLRAVAVTLDVAPVAEVSGLEATTLERLMTRLLGASFGFAAEGEAIAVALFEKDGATVFTVGLPLALAGVGRGDLLDPGFSPDAPFPDAPLLGLGFTLRLIDSVARGAGGRFAIGPASFAVTLPGRVAASDLPVGARKE